MAKERSHEKHETETKWHGDPLSSEVEPNAGQRQSDAPPDVVGGAEALRGRSDRAEARRSTANGVPAFDEDAEKQRKNQYQEGAGLVSEID